MVFSAKKDFVMKTVTFGNHGKLASISSTVAIALVGLAVATPAFGQTPVVVVVPSDVVTRQINHADLNLAAAAGERTLKHRVSGAVSGLCSEALGGRDAGFAFKYSMIECRTVAWDQARPQMARAVQRARDIASTGTSPIAASAITVVLPK